MKKYIIKSILLLVVCILLSVSCTDDFQEINTNPNAPEQLSNPGLLLPALLRSAMNDHYTGSWRRADIVADYLANQFVSAFDWSPADAEEYFLWSYYDRLRNLNTMMDMATERDLKNFQGLILVLKSFMYQSMTDIYGDIPYSQAIQAKSNNINFPAYDTQETIYNGILADLEEANTLLSTGTDPLTGDILYNGDVLKWRKFANSLQLRCLMRISDRKDPAADMARIVGDPAKYPLFETYQDQAALQYLDELGNEFPRYRDTGYGGTTHASTTLVDTLQWLNDPRLYVFALPTPATAGGNNPQYAGVPNGIPNEDLYNGGSANQSPPGLLWAPTTWDAELASPTAAQSLMMTNSELQFILAEAAEKGFITGDPAVYYQKGVQDQFDYYASRIPDNYVFPKAADVQPPAAYFTQQSVTYTGTQEEKLHKIWLQKWLALFNCGYEGWSEWRRTGVPEIVAGPNSLGFVPVRFIYPLSEQNYNKKNYDAAVARQGADNTQTRVWWDVN